MKSTVHTAIYLLLILAGDDGINVEAFVTPEHVVLNNHFLSKNSRRHQLHHLSNRQIGDDYDRSNIVLYSGMSGRDMESIGLRVITVAGLAEAALQYANMSNVIGGGGMLGKINVGAALGPAGGIQAMAAALLFSLLFVDNFSSLKHNFSRQQQQQQQQQLPAASDGYGYDYDYAEAAATGSGSGGMDAHRYRDAAAVVNTPTQYYNDDGTCMEASQEYFREEEAMYYNGGSLSTTAASGPFAGADMTNAATAAASLFSSETRPPEALGSSASSGGGDAKMTAQSSAHDSSSIFGSGDYLHSIDMSSYVGPAAPTIPPIESNPMFADADGLSDDTISYDVRYTDSQGVDQPVPRIMSDDEMRAFLDDIFCSNQKSLTGLSSSYLDSIYVEGPRQPQRSDISSSEGMSYLDSIHVETAERSGGSDAPSNFGSNYLDSVSSSSFSIPGNCISSVEVGVPAQTKDKPTPVIASIFTEEAWKNPPNAPATFLGRHTGLISSERASVVSVNDRSSFLNGHAGSLKCPKPTRKNCNIKKTSVGSYLDSVSRFSFSVPDVKPSIPVQTIDVPPPAVTASIFTEPSWKKTEAAPASFLGGHTDTLDVGKAFKNQAQFLSGYLDSLQSSIPVRKAENSSEGRYLDSVSKFSFSVPNVKLSIPVQSNDAPPPVVTASIFTEQSWKKTEATPASFLGGHTCTLGGAKNQLQFLSGHLDSLQSSVHVRKVGKSNVGGYIDSVRSRSFSVPKENPSVPVTNNDVPLAVLAGHMETVGNEKVSTAPDNDQSSLVSSHLDSALETDKAQANNTPSPVITSIFAAKNWKKNGRRHMSFLEGYTGTLAGGKASTSLAKDGPSYIGGHLASLRCSTRVRKADKSSVGGYLDFVNSGSFSVPEVQHSVQAHDSIVSSVSNRARSPFPVQANDTPSVTSPVIASMFTEQAWEKEGANPASFLGGYTSTLASEKAPIPFSFLSGYLGSLQSSASARGADKAIPCVGGYLDSMSGGSFSIPESVSYNSASVISEVIHVNKHIPTLDDKTKEEPCKVEVASTILGNALRKTFSGANVEAKKAARNKIMINIAYNPEDVAEQKKISSLRLVFDKYIRSRYSSMRFNIVKQAPGRVSIGITFLV